MFLLLFSPVMFSTADRFLRCCSRVHENVNTCAGCDPCDLPCVNVTRVSDTNCNQKEKMKGKKRKERGEKDI